MIVLFSLLPALSTRRHLLYVYHLCCSCLTGASPEFPAILLQDVDTLILVVAFRMSGFQFSLICQIVPGYMAVPTTESARAEYRDLDSQFSSGSVACDPWSHLEYFGRSTTSKVLSSAQVSKVLHWSSSPVLLWCQLSEIDQLFVPLTMVKKVDIPAAEISKTHHELWEEPSQT